MPSLRSDNVHLHPTNIDPAARARLLDQQPSVLWFTGLSGSGKSTVANLVEVALHARGHLTFMLDGDNVRHGLCGDLGFSDADRGENIRRVSEVAKLMHDAGLIVLASFISPFQADRELARTILPPGAFFEVYVNLPLELAEARDPKGLYAKARRGEITQFTGIDSPYEAPTAPELALDMAALTAEQAAAQVVAALAQAGRLSGPAQPGTGPRARAVSR